jgi:hypothetical protein
MLRLFTRGHPKAVEKWNAPIHALNKGIVIPSDDILVEQQPDGRVRLKLSAAARQKLGLTVTPAP